MLPGVCEGFRNLNAYIGITVGSTDAERYRRSRVVDSAGNIRFTRRDAVQLVRAFIAQHFFDGAAEQIQLCCEFRARQDGA